MVFFFPLVQFSVSSFSGWLKMPRFLQAEWDDQQQPKKGSFQDFCVDFHLSSDCIINHHPCAQPHVSGSQWKEGKKEEKNVNILKALTCPWPVSYSAFIQTEQNTKHMCTFPLQMELWLKCRTPWYLLQQRHIMWSSLAFICPWKTATCHKSHWDFKQNSNSNI